MADLIYSRNIFDGGRKLVHSIVDVSDGTGYSAQMIDVGNLNTNAQGALCNRINLQKLWFNSNLAAAASPIRIQWNVGGGTNIDLLTLEELQTQKQPVHQEMCGLLYHQQLFQVKELQLYLNGLKLTYNLKNYG